MIVLMLIEVTQEHIDAGKRAECGSCPVALAFKEAFPNRMVRAGYGVLQAYQWGAYVFKARTPLDVQLFMLEFDEGRPVQPFTFEVENELV